MATKKKTKTRTARPAGKKPAAAKKPARAAARADKRTRKASGPAPKASPKARVMVVPPSEPLFRATELDGSERKPAKKAEPVRPPRPPARLPIPQSTYFF